VLKQFSAEATAQGARLTLIELDAALHPCEFQSRSAHPIEHLPLHIEMPVRLIEGAMLERVGSELMNRQREELHDVLRKRHRRPVDDNVLGAGRDADRAQFPLHKIPERDVAAIVT
jgi:hypothetical protein